MSQFSQYCSYQGHEENKVKFICLDIKCQQKRLFCSDCFLNNHVKHENTKHIKDHKGFQIYIQQQIEQLQKQLQEGQDIFVQRSIDIIKKMQFQINNILEILKEIQTKLFLQNEILNLQDQLQCIKKTKLYQIDDQFINQLLNINLQYNRQFMIIEIKKEYDILMKNSIKLQQLSVQEFQIEKLKNIEYEITQYEQLIDSDIHSTTISYDSKYLVSSSEEKYMKIWDNLNSKLIQEYNSNDFIHISKFTDDNQILYTGTDQGLLCCYNVQNNFKQTYKQKIHFHSILNLYCINNNLVLTSSFDKRIIKTNTQLKQQLLVIQAHDERIDGLDYHRQKDVIASCSIDNFIKLWDNQNGSLLASKSLVNQSIIRQVLLINNSDQLISLDSKSNINIWDIKYESRELLLVKSINDFNLIFGISLVLDQSLILSVCEEKIKFYTIQGEFVYQIKHDIKEFYMIRGVQQDSIQSIIIQGKNQLKILNMKK